jgi:hypothetical protein
VDGGDEEEIGILWLLIGSMIQGCEGVIWDHYGLGIGRKHREALGSIGVHWGALYHRRMGSDHVALTRSGIHLRSSLHCCFLLLAHGLLSTMSEASYDIPYKNGSESMAGKKSGKAQVTGGP